MIDVEGVTMVRKSSTSSLASLDNNASNNEGGSNNGVMYFEVPVVKSSEDVDDVFDSSERASPVLTATSIMKGVTSDGTGIKPDSADATEALGVAAVATASSGADGGGMGSPEEQTRKIEEKQTRKDALASRDSITTSDATTDITQSLAEISLEQLPSIPGYAPAFIISSTEYLVHMPNELVSRMIGPSGAVLGQLQENSGASITVNEDSQDGLNYRSVKITGEQSQVELCHKLLEQVIAPRDGSHLASAVLAMDIPLEQVGLIIGKFGSTIRQLQSASHTRIEMPRDGQTAVARKILIRGSPDAVAFCKNMILNKLRDGRESAAKHHTAQRYGTNSYRVTIPEMHIGRVIGKKGAHIRQLQEESGAKVVLPKENNPGTMTRDVIIYGDESQANHCHKLLMDMITPPLHKTAEIPMFQCTPDEAARSTIVAPPTYLQQPYQIKDMPYDPSGMMPFMQPNPYVYGPVPPLYPGMLSPGMMMPISQQLPLPPPSNGYFPQQRYEAYEYRISGNAFDIMLRNKALLEQEFGVLIQVPETAIGRRSSSNRLSSNI